MTQMTQQERDQFETRVKEHNYAVLIQLDAALGPLRVQLDQVQELASGLIITDGTEMLRIRDVLVANISSLKSMMDYHVNNTLAGVITSVAPPAPAPELEVPNPTPEV
jgi:hypothetical protein